MKKIIKIFMTFIFVLSMCLSSQISYAESDNIGSFIVTGGTYGVDYEYANYDYLRIQCGAQETVNSDTAIPKNKLGAISVKALIIKTSTPLTISTKNVSADGIYVESGVHADITFNNVNIESYIPFNIPTNKDNPTVVHLTLADNSNNSLKAKLGDAVNYQSPGLRCGEGSYLTIDDERRNVDVNGQVVEPEDGKVSRDTTLQDGTVVKKGDRLTILDSENPGTLTVDGGYRAAAIGGGPIENSGIMTFNGGNIVARAFGPTESRYGAGTGIGGGHAGGGTTITINGGNIDAYGSYHGAGFGGGCTYGGGMSNSSERSLVFEDAIFCKTPLHTIAGDININGGYLKSRGYIHSNAFGQGCGGTNTGKTIRITGGTLLPTSEGDFKDIGGEGGKVIITGGSVRLTNNDKSKFQSSDGKAYDDNNSEVFMTTIDLKSENLSNNIIQDWALYVNGELTKYGSPSMLDNGQLYLWLPKSAEGKEIRVGLSVQDESVEGGILTPEDLFISDAKEGNATLKRFVEFEVPKDWQEKNLVKRYDGLPFQPYPLTKENYIETQESPAKQLTDSTKMTYKYQYYKEDDLVGAEYDNLPKDSGEFQIVMTSTQFATPGSDFYNSYWGHRAYGKASIQKADATMYNTTYDPSYYVDEEGVTQVESIKLHADLKPKDGEAKTCEAPDGYIQFYINGVKVGDPVKLVASANKTSDGYAYSSADLTLQFKDNPNYPRVPESLTDEKFTVVAEYYDAQNYEGQTQRVTHKVVEGKPDVGEFEEPENFPYVVPPIPVVTPTPPSNPDEEVTGDQQKPDVIVREETEGDKTILHSYVYDKLSTSTKPNTVKGKSELIDMLNHRYTFANSNNTILEIAGETVKIEDITISDDNGEEGNTLDSIDMSKEGVYILTTTVSDADGNKTTLELTYDVSGFSNPDDTPKVDVDTDGDGFPDTNIDTDKDGKPDINIDKDGDGKPDVNIDTDGDGKPDVNIDTDGDGKPDINIDTDGDGKPDVNVDTDGDDKPDVNIDKDDDGKPDINIVDKDKDGKPDNIDPSDPKQDKTPDLNIVDKDKDGIPDDLDKLPKEEIKDLEPDVDIDTDGDGKPDVNVDTDGDGKPDVNIDKDGDGKPDLNIVDKDKDGKPDNIDPSNPSQDKTPDLNIVDKDKDGIPDDLDDLTKEEIKDLDPDVNIDTDGNGKPDVNVDTDKDGKPDINIDTDGDGKPDVNVDTDGDDKPDTNIDKDGDGEPDLNIDPDGDGKPDINIVDKDGDGKPDDLDDKWPNIKDVNPDVNIDTDRDGKTDVNVDVDGDGKPDVNIVDKDRDGKPDTNIEPKEDVYPDTNIDTDRDGIPDINIDTDGDGIPDINIVDKDKDGKPDTNINPKGKVKPDLNIDTDGDGKADLNIDVDGDGIPDLNIDTNGDGIADKNIDKDGDGVIDVEIQGEDTENHHKKVKTSDEISIYGLSILTIASLLMGSVLLTYKKKENE